jgi:branched-chain amino acid transport system permease protein
MFWLKRIGSGILAILACFVIDSITHHSFGSYEQRIIALVGIYVTLAVSLNLINGITGQFSIGHAAFYQVGAYTAGFISRRYITDAGHTPPPVIWLVGMVLVAAAAASVAGFIVGLPSLRLKGDYLAIVTLGFGEIIRILVQNTDALGGSYALDKIPKIQEIWLIWLLAFICIAVCRNLLKTARGLTFLAVREDEVASSAMGVNVTRVKVTAFVLGSAFAGAAGAMLAHYEGLITPATFTMDVSFIILTMVVLGGTGSITGSVVAAIFLSYLPEYLRTLKASDGQPLVVSGTAIVAALAVTVIAVACIKTVLNRQLLTPKKRGLIYVGIIIGAVVLELPVSKLLSPIHSLAVMQVEAAQLRMVIFAVTLIVLMLLRPQGVFAHHEFSWDWVKKLMGRTPAPTTEVSA